MTRRWNANSILQAGALGPEGISVNAPAGLNGPLSRDMRRTSRNSKIWMIGWISTCLRIASPWSLMNMEPACPPWTFFRLGTIRSIMDGGASKCREKLTSPASPASPVQVIVRVMVQVIATVCGKTSGCLVAVATSAVTGLTNGGTALGPATGLVDLGKSDGLTAGARRTMTMRTMRTMIASGTVTNMIRNGKDPSAGLAGMDVMSMMSGPMAGMDRMASMRVRDKLWSNKKNRPHMEMQPGLGKAMPIMHLLRDFGAFRDLQDFRQCLKILRRRKQTSNLGVFRQWKVLGIQSRKTQGISIPSFLNFFKMIRIQKLQANSQPVKLTKFVNRKLWLHWWWWRDMPAPAAIPALPSGPHVKITFSARQSVTRKWWMTLQMLQTFRPSAREGPRNCHLNCWMARVARMLLMSIPLPDVCSKATVGSANRYAQKSEKRIIGLYSNLTGFSHHCH